MRIVIRSCGFNSLAAIVLALLLGACTATEVTPQLVVPAGEKIDTVVIGDITTDKDLWKLYVPHVRHGLVERLKKSNVFQKVIISVPDSLPPSSIVISGKITEIDKGSKAARWIIGFGAGTAEAKGVFEIKDIRGVVKAKFETKKSYAGGAGIGGADFVDMDELVQQLGQETADSIVRWSKGLGLKPPAP